MSFNKIYYFIKPIIPRRIQIAIRSRVVLKKRKAVSNVWPINEKAGDEPKIWPGWPDGKKFALILTHDVDTQRGHDRCMALSDLESNMGFRSSFNFVAKRYNVSPSLRQHLVDNGFEVGLHGLYHDGKKFNSYKIFKERAALINQYIDEWGAVGFRSPAMHSNLEWIGELDIEYDASTFDTDPFEPQPEGVGTIFPFQVLDGSHEGYVELPYTLPQDFTLFVLMKEKNIDIWKRKLDWIANKGGMALINVHPDYMSFNDRPKKDEYQAEYYRTFLKYVKDNYESKYWHVLPREIAKHWKSHSLTNKGEI